MSYFEALQASVAMHPALPAALAAEYRRQREALLVQFPELVDDDAALADTLEGISHAPDLIAKFIRDARADEAMTSALGAMIKDMHERKQRLAMRADRRRLAAQRLMEACQMRKLEMPDFSAHIRNVPGKVEIDDEALLPDELCRVVREPDKAKIKEALVSRDVPGAHMGNGGGETLSIRTK